jgi:DNA modification methylase
VNDTDVVIHGDCIEVLKSYPADFFDSCVTDPPYDLLNKKGGTGQASRDSAKNFVGFMGLAWDGTGIAFDPATWREVYRVLKPGAHMLAFGGSRTYHRLACAIEDAGFEIRDTITWLYGSGFPKSLDVSKAIDKMGADLGLLEEMATTLRLAREARGLTVPECDAMFCGSSTAWPWYEGRTYQGRRTIQPPNEARARQIAAAWPETAGVFDRMNLRGALLGQRTHARGGNGDFPKSVGSPAAPNTAEEFDHATDEARQWAGWGTALKPAMELIVVARKPLSERNVATNVLRWGVGALNIDASRIGTAADVSLPGNVNPTRASGSNGIYGKDHRLTRQAEWRPHAGRFPANVVLSHVGGPDGCKQIGTTTVRRDLRELDPDPNANGAVYAGRREAGHGFDGGSRSIGSVPEQQAVWECVPDCAVRLLDEQAGPQRDGDAVHRHGHKVGGYGGAGSASRFFATFNGRDGEASAERRDEGATDFAAKPGARREPVEETSDLFTTFEGSLPIESGDELRFRYTAKADNAERSPNMAKRNGHPTVKNLDLMGWMIRLVTPPGGVCLDCFGGSGTTAIAAIGQGFRWVLIEKESEYCDIAMQRIGLGARLIEFGGDHD